MSFLLACASSPLLPLTAADKRQLALSLSERSRIGRDRHRSKPCRDGADIFFSQMGGDQLHAIRRNRGPEAIAPCSELGADVIGAQSVQTRYAGLAPVQIRPVASHAGWHLLCRVTVHHQCLTALQYAFRHRRTRRRQIRLLLLCFVFGFFFFVFFCFFCLFVFFCCVFFFFFLF